jgi:diphthamide biosynthesis enzyme Dph1/Dph2-like protein
MNYDLELTKAIDKITEAEAKLVCIQLPDGMKSQAKVIQDTIEAKTGAKVIIWLGSCYGACDWPLGIDKMGVDLLVAWGHSVWRHNEFEGISVE